MNSVKTPNGTELPLINLKGKNYLEVKYRILWFREVCPAWTIETELVKIGENYAICRAIIKDDGGRVVSTSHKYEDKQSFHDYIEKCETGAIGRALALIGYGTQFATELEEGSRIVDAPIQRKETPGPNMQSPYPPKSSGQRAGHVGQILTEKQINRLWAISKRTKWSETDIYNYIQKMGLKDVTELNLQQYDNLCGKMEKFPNNQGSFAEGPPPVDYDEYMKSQSLDRLNS